MKGLNACKPKSGGWHILASVVGYWFAFKLAVLCEMINGSLPKHTIKPAKCLL